MIPTSERLQRVLAEGNALALFPVLKDWPTEELQALLRDVEEFHTACYAAIDEGWEQIAFHPSIFFGGPQSRALDRIRDDKKMAVMMVLSEICSVAIFYLNERGIKTEVDGEEE